MAPAGTVRQPEGTGSFLSVVPDAQQPRAEFAPEALSRLADSIREHGQLAPIRVRWSDELGKWVIIAGERRWRAAKPAGLPAIECYFHTDEMSPSEVLEQQLIENLLREDLKPVEEARSHAALMELNGWTGKQVAERLRVPASQVSRALALLRLPDDIRQRVDAGEIAARAGYELSKLENADHQCLRTTIKGIALRFVDVRGDPPYNTTGWTHRPRRQAKETGMASPQSQELARRAGVIYEQRLRAQLEHTHPDKFVAIEPDSGDYFLGRTLSDAIQAARSAHPTRLPFVLRVGHEATVELGVTLS